MKTCKYQSLLGLYFDNALSEQENDEIAQHLNSSTRCECLKELARLSKIERIVKNDLFKAPPENYWDEVSDNILAKIGGMVKPVEASWFETFIADSVAFIEANALKLSFSGAFAVGVLVLLFTVDFTGFEEQNQAAVPDVNPQAPVVETARNIASAGSKLVATLEQDNFEINDAPVMSDVDLQNIVALNKNARTKVLPIGNRAIAALEINFGGELIPLPIYEVQFGSDDDAGSEDKKRFGQQTFAQSLNGARYDVDNLLKENSETVEGENDFAATLWIVQQTESLSEKKNIWLSYVSRETNSTYRYMGVYNLALVFAKISIESKDPEKAQEALEFLKSNAASLTFQMTEQRFNNIKNTLNLIAERY